MIKSMTGFGQAASGKAKPGFAVEIRSWNHRFFEFSARLPNSFLELEERIRDLVYQRIKRGKITFSLSVKGGSDEWNGLALDEKKVDFYIRAMRNVQKKYRLSDAISINTLFTIPNLFVMDRSAKSALAYWPKLKPVIEQAIRQLELAKVREGASLSADLVKRTASILDAVGQIEQTAKTFPFERRKQLQERIQTLTNGTQLDSERLEREVALMAERSDITEEIVRARHHLKMTSALLKGGGEAGKKLDFISQEIHREANTISSKAQHSAIQEQVIRIKGELEKIREQIQNIE